MRRTPAQLRRLSALNVVYNGRVVVGDNLPGRLEVCTPDFAGFITVNGRLIRYR